MKLKENRYYIHAAEIVNDGGIFVRRPLPVVIVDSRKFMNLSRAVEIVTRELNPKEYVEIVKIKRKIIITEEIYNSESD